MFCYRQSEGSFLENTSLKSHPNILPGHVLILLFFITFALITIFKGYNSSVYKSWYTCMFIYTYICTHDISLSFYIMYIIKFYNVNSIYFFCGRELSHIFNFFSQHCMIPCCLSIKANIHLIWELFVIFVILTIFQILQFFTSFFLVLNLAALTFSSERL